MSSNHLCCSFLLTLPSGTSTGVKLIETDVYEDEAARKGVQISLAVVHVYLGGT